MVLLITEALPIVTIFVTVGLVVAVPTIIDVLSSSVQYSTLLKHIRRHDLVPLINEARNLTLIAPVNSAFASIHDEEEDITLDVLLYHLLNGTVISSDLGGNGVMVLESLLSSTDSNGAVTGTYPVTVSRETNHDENSIGQGMLINGEVKVVEKDMNRDTPMRGVVQAVNHLLPVPRSFCGLEETNVANYSIFSNLLSFELDCQAGNRGLVDATTVFAPSNNAFKKYFNEIELNYLSHTAAAEEDRSHILHRHMVKGLIKPQNGVKSSILTSFDGSQFWVSLPHMVINGTFFPNNHSTIIENGMIYSYDDVLQDAESPVVEFTPAKYLYGLEADKMVSEVIYRNLDYLIDGSALDLPQTIFVPISMIQLDDDDEYISEGGGLKSRSSLLYHFVSGQHHLNDYIGKNLLMDTKMRASQLNGGYQKLKFASSASGAFYLNGNPVVSTEFSIGKTSIYLIGDDLDLPPSLSQSLGPFFQNSYSLKFLESLNMLYPPKKTPWTVLLPTRRAWKDQALVAKYLSSNETALRHVFNSMIFETPIYSDTVGSKQVRLLTNDTVDVSISGENNDTLHLGGKTYRLDARDILFDSGVAHSIDHVLVPEAVSINAADLISAGERSEFITLLHERNMSHVLGPKTNNTILVPSPEYLDKYNVTVDSPDIDFLLSMHIIPHDPVGSLLQGDSVPTMAENVSLSAREVSEGIYVIQVVGGSEHVLHIVDKGETSVYEQSKSRSTVLFLDRMIRPEWLDNPFPPFRHSPEYQLKTPVAMLLGAVGGFFVLFVVMTSALFVVMKNTNRIPGSKVKEDYYQQRQPLLDSTSPNNEYDSINNPTRPINTTSIQQDREFGRHLNLPPGNPNSIR